MAQTHNHSRTKQWRYRANQTLHIMSKGLVMVAFIPHYRIYKRGTFWPMKEILDSRTEAELRDKLHRWVKYKQHESGYCQVAGAVIFASVTSCLSWSSLPHAHWSGPALWYGTIILALACIFTGAQQSLVLPEADSIDKLPPEDTEKMKISFVSDTTSHRPSIMALFAWQIPVMLLGYAVVAFLAGLCSVVLSPFAHRPAWNDNSKIAVLFISVSAFSLFCWLLPSPIVHRLGSART